MEVIKSIISDIERYYRKSYNGVYPGDFTKLAEEAISELRIEEQLSILSKSIGNSIEGKKILEIGSGFGGLIALANKKYSNQTYGVEPDKEIFQISLQVLEAYGININYVTNTRGENLPFEDATFDVVFSVNVLEHVQHPNMVISEAIRVLKPGGYIYFVIPNYGSFWEGHYGIFWIPYIPKWLGKIYVSLLGRDTRFIDTLQFINYWQLKLLLRRYKNIKILNWGEDIFEERMTLMNFSEWAQLGRLKKVVNLAHQLKITKIICLAARIFKMHTPIILTLQKME
ncbi:MAG: class I SAM-dependent methyltransferase [bacterium]